MSVPGMPLIVVLMLIVIAAAVLASLSLWAWIAARLWSGRRVVAWQPQRPVPWDLVTLAPLALMVLASLTSSRGDDRSPVDVDALPSMLMVNMALSLTIAAASVSLAVLRSGATATDLGWDVDRAGEDIRLGAAGFVALLLPVYGLQAVLTHFQPYQHPLIEMLQRRPDAAGVLLAAASAVVVAPLVEEVLFRVLLQGWLEACEARLLARKPPAVPDQQPAGRPAGHGAAVAADALPADPGGTRPPQEVNPYSSAQLHSDSAGQGQPTAEAISDQSQGHDDRRFFGLPRGWWPILASSLIFALVHIGHGPAPVPLFVFALGLGYLYQRTHRLLPSLVAHMLLNLSSLVMLWISLTA
jgi:membrane protease YdiL (CAAX protease family)